MSYRVNITKITIPKKARQKTRKDTVYFSKDSTHSFCRGLIILLKSGKMIASFNLSNTPKKYISISIIDNQSEKGMSIMVHSKYERDIVDFVSRPV